jgi:hypothetical protein
MIDKKYSAIVKATEGLPPDEVFTQNPTVENGKQFMQSKYTNSLINSRLASFFDEGIEPIKPPQELDGYVRAVADWRLAQYKLLFEVWDWFKPLAIQERLLPPNANRGDCMRLIYEQKHIAVFAAKPVKKRTLNDWATKAIKNNELKSQIKTDIDLNKVVSPIELLKREDANRKAFSEMPRLESLLEEVAQRVALTDDDVKKNYIAMGKALETSIKVGRKYVHHKNKTR